MKRLICMVAGAMLAFGCNGNVTPEKVYEKPLVTPTKVTFEQLGYTSDIIIRWKDNSEGEVAFSIWNGKEQVATVPANTTEYLYQGLEQGRNYSIGVRADAGDPVLHSDIKYADVAIADYSKIPFPQIQEVSSSPTSLGVSYNFKKIQYATKEAWGLCWSADHTPTIEDAHAHGPIVLRDENPIFQAIPNVTLDYGRTYRIRAYVMFEGTAYYSDEVEASLGNEPEAVTLSWDRMDIEGLPADIEVYSTTQKLNGRPFNAWYAVADITKGNVEWRVRIPSASATVDKQFQDADGECYVLTNGAYFNMSTGTNLGFSSFKGSMTGSVETAAGTLAGGFPESSSYYFVNKGTFGVDAGGNPSAYWIGTGNGVNYFYDSPMATVKGRDKYQAPSAGYPTQSVDWNPYYAITAGPVLVKNGKIVFDDVLTQPTEDSKNEFFLTNWELTAYDIFSATLSPDRTAVGYTADGKVILFVCDGRIVASEGATIFELAQIMKGLGCVDAVNFDGGGSTAMVAMGKRLNSLVSNTSGATENRKVASTMGFFIKK